MKHIIVSSDRMNLYAGAEFTVEVRRNEIVLSKEAGLEEVARRR